MAHLYLVSNFTLYYILDQPNLSVNAYSLYYCLCFSRKNCCYNQVLFTLHGDSILEDLVITLADGIASMYLELISVDGNLTNEMNNLGMIMCSLSTRALQRLRNEV